MGLHFETSHGRFPLSLPHMSPGPSVTPPDGGVDRGRRPWRGLDIQNTKQAWKLKTRCWFGRCQIQSPLSCPTGVPKGRLGPLSGSGAHYRRSLGNLGRWSCRHTIRPELAMVHGDRQGMGAWYFVGGGRYAWARLALTSGTKLYGAGSLAERFGIGRPAPGAFWRLGPMGEEKVPCELECCPCCECHFCEEQVVAGRTLTDRHAAAPLRARRGKCIGELGRSVLRI